jgi:hypothetical protein
VSSYRVWRTHCETKWALLQLLGLKAFEYKSKKSLKCTEDEWVVYSEVGSSTLEGYMGQFGRCVVAVKYGKVVDVETLNDTDRVVVCNTDLGYQHGDHPYPVVDMCILREPLLLRCPPGLSPVQDEDKAAVNAAISRGTRAPFDWVHRRWIQKELELQLTVMRECVSANDMQYVYLQGIVGKFSPACVARPNKKR